MGIQLTGDPGHKHAASTNAVSANLGPYLGRAVPTRQGGGGRGRWQAFPTAEHAQRLRRIQQLVLQLSPERVPTAYPLQIYHSDRAMPQSARVETAGESLDRVAVKVFLLTSIAAPVQEALRACIHAQAKPWAYPCHQAHREAMKGTGRRVASE